MTVTQITSHYHLPIQRLNLEADDHGGCHFCQLRNLRLQQLIGKMFLTMSNAL